MLLCALALAALAPAAPAQTAPSAVELLLRSARYWQARGREDRAAEAYEKVLRSDPRDIEALSALGSQAARLGKLDKAHDYWNRLNSVAPNSADAKSVERAIAIGGEFERLLAQARTLARESKPDESVAVYRQLFGEGGPPRHLGLEFYATLGGTKDGWKEAADGLARLLAQSPGEPVYRLALARVQTYREETRREGIASLAKLVSENVLADEADPAQRQALLWLRLSPADDVLLTNYLARHADDAEIRKRLAEPHADAHGAEVAAGFQALERSDVNAAEKIFKSAPHADQSTDALVGQGLVAFKRGEFARARDLFTKVKQLAPEKTEIWERSLRSATFWALMADGRAAQADHRPDDAEALFVQASKSGAAERAYAEVVLAQLSLERGEVGKAELRLRALLRERPDMPEALRGLLEVLIRQGQREEAESVNEKLAQSAPKLALEKGALEAELLRSSAARSLEQGRPDLARAALIAARAADVHNLWVIHDLANAELELGDAQAAREAAAELLHLDPSMLEARITWVRVLANAGENQAALEAIAALPPEALTQEMRTLKPLLQVRSEAERILRRAPHEKRELVRDDLLRLQQRVHGQPGAASAVAHAWVVLGDTQRAVELMNQAVASNPDSAANLKLDLAAVLLGAGQDGPLLALLSELDADPHLAPRDRRGLVDLKVAVTVRRADKFREQGDLQQAFNTLAGPLNDLPDQPRLLCALGRLFNDGDRAKDGLAVFERVLESDPDNLEAREGAVRSAANLRHIDDARRFVDEGLKRAPRDPRLRLLAARLDVQLGHDGAAMDHLDDARKLVASSLTAEEAASGAQLTHESSVPEMLDEARKQFSENKGRPAAETIELQDAIQREIDAIRERHSAYVSATADLRARAGESGLSQLTALRAPVEIGLPLGYHGRFLLTATPTVLDAGGLAFASEDVAHRFGSGEVPLNARPDLEIGMRASGTELRAGYQDGGLALDVGSTPLGFLLKTYTGGIRYRSAAAGFGFAVEASRRLVEDSMLSMAGVYDPLSGITWGQVTRNGGRLDLGYTTADTTWFLWGAYDVLLGTHGVSSNSEGSGGLGLEWTVVRSTLASLGTGLSVTALGYQNNLRYFTLGQGGYFSPQGFLNASVPFRLHGEAGKLKWTAQVNPGLNWFTENRTPYFPRDPSREIAREQEVDSTGAPLTAFYPSTNTTAFAIDAQGDLAYALSEHLEAGAYLRLHHAEDYDELQAGVFLRFSFLGRETHETTNELVRTPWSTAPER